MKVFIEQLQNGVSLTEEQMTRAMTKLMSGETSEEHIADFLNALADKGETIDEITGAARVLREKAAGIKAPYGAVDCCGTGGDASGTYNISTTVAIVAAACGVPIAKHGNRASSSKSGAADVLEVLGVNLDAPLDILEYALKTLNFAFLMAPKHHESMKHVAAVRKSLGRRTIFNILGPLANPAGTRLQLIGVYDKTLLRPFAEVLKKLGTKRAWIVHGEDGLDEITTTGRTYVVKLNEEGIITEEILTPESFGLKQSSLDKLKGGEAEDNAKALRALLEGQKCAYRDIVLANTAAVLCIQGKAETLTQGVEKAAKAIDSGEANQLLKDYIILSRSNIEDLEL
jgi:anthranilate phosphoribosyltransferase